MQFQVGSYSHYGCLTQAHQDSSCKFDSFFDNIDKCNIPLVDYKDCVRAVKTGSPQVLLGGPGGQGTRVEVSPDTSRA